MRERGKKKKQYSENIFTAVRPRRLEVDQRQPAGQLPAGLAGRRRVLGPGLRLELSASVLTGLTVTHKAQRFGLFGRHAALVRERNRLLVMSLSYLCNISHYFVCEVFDYVHLALSFPLKERLKTLQFDKQGVVEKSVKLWTVIAITHSLFNLLYICVL